MLGLGFRDIHLCIFSSFEITSLMKREGGGGERELVSLPYLHPYFKWLSLCLCSELACHYVIVFLVIHTRFCSFNCTTVGQVNDTLST